MLENLPQIMFEADEKNKAAVDADFARDDSHLRRP